MSTGTIDHLYGYLDNLASIATSKCSTLTQLIECNASLTKSYEALMVAYNALAKKPAPVAAATKGTSNKNKARPEPTYSLMATAGQMATRWPLRTTASHATTKMRATKLV